MSRGWAKGQSRVTWTPEMTAELVLLRAANEPLLLCAERIGVCYRTAVFKARELGIASRRNSGRITGKGRYSVNERY